MNRDTDSGIGPARASAAIGAPPTGTLEPAGSPDMPGGSRSAMELAAGGVPSSAGGSSASGTPPPAGTAPQGVREGSLEAPTRHPIDWRNPDFYDEEVLFAELERVFDICHGCRRCVSLCNAFPTLFDLVDESETMEVDGVSRSDYGKVVEQCYLCDLCYMTKCPYVPPHEWNVDFPHLMLRAKAVSYRRGEVKLRDRLITRTDVVGRFASFPVIVNAVNAANRSKPVRAVMDAGAGIHREANLPPYDSMSIRRRLRKLPSTVAGFGAGANPDADTAQGSGIGSEPPSGSTPGDGGGAAVRPAAGEGTRGQVVLFGTCYGSWNEPRIGEDLAAVFEHNGIAVRLAPSERCCGMPRLELGDLESVERAKSRNIGVLAPLVDEGFDIVAPVPSCVLMFKQELPLMFPEDERVAKVKAAIFDPFEYLAQRHREGLLRTDFRHSLGTVAYHAACHQRVQNIGPKTRDVLGLVPDTRVSVIERCSGHDGTYAVKRESYAHSMKIVRPVVRRIRDEAPDHFGSDCPMAGNHIAHGLCDGRAAELDAYNPLIPDGSNWKATFMIEFDDEDERQVALGRMVGIEDRVWAKVGDASPVWAIADEDLERTTEDKTSSVHFLRFELPGDLAAAARCGAPIAVGIDHPAYSHRADPAPESVRASLAADLDPA